MKHRTFTLIIFLSLLLASCSDRINPNLLTGTYMGYFYHIKPGETNIIKSPQAITLKITENEYNSDGHESRIPAGGSGEYTFQNNNEIEFIEKNAWTADFDWNLILNGRFLYEIKNDSLILTRKFEICKTCNIKLGMMPGLYQYRMRRTN